MARYMSPRRRKRLGMDAPPPPDDTGEEVAESEGDGLMDGPSIAEAASVTLPAAVLGGKEWNEGDQIVLTISGKNDDGSVTATYATEEEAEAAPEPPPTMAGALDGMPG